MQITLPEAISLFRIKILKTYTTDPKTKFLIQRLDDKGNLVFALYLVINEARFPSLIDNLNIEASSKMDVARHLTIMRNNIYVIEPNRYKMWHARNSINFKRSDEFKHMVHADPDTKTIHTYKNDKHDTEFYAPFNYWNNTKFEVIISLKPTDIDELLAPDGVLIDLSSYQA